MSEFYIGYLPKAPPATARFLRRMVAGVAVLASLAALVVTLSQMPFARSSFEFGHARNFEGVIASKPTPMLLVPRPGSDEFSQYLLVAPGKHGADSLVAAFDGLHVRLRGQLIYRDGQTMVEIDAQSITTLGPAGNPELQATDLGPASLAGEIVDSKCYLGVMNPGRGKVHRDCAARCLSGGIPAALLTSAGDVILLLDHNGKPFSQDRLREFAGEAVVVRGSLVRRGDLKIIKARDIARKGPQIRN
ncbi:MAG: hypothetical protein JST79_11480 [Acidobacteria bacterium]|nr:hypothetical protein [Acidobacteriota bacterium]